MMDKCPQCKRKFKRIGDMSLITEANINGVYAKICPLCYAEEVKQIHGIDWNPTGEFASSMFDYAKEQYPDWKN